MTHVFVDGSCVGNPGHGGWSVVIKQDPNDTILYGKSGHTTNSRMELTAMLEALKYIHANHLPDCHIHSDSQYVTRGINEFMHGWIAKGWRKSDGKLVANQDLWKTISVLLENIPDVIVSYVPGHVGISGNEKADTIAGLAARNTNKLISQLRCT